MPLSFLHWENTMLWTCPSLGVVCRLSKIPLDLHHRHWISALPKGFACCHCYCWHLGWWGAKNLHIKQNFDMFNDLSTPPLWKMMFIWTKMNSLVEKNQSVTNWFVITCNWLSLVTNFLYFYDLKSHQTFWSHLWLCCNSWVFHSSYGTIFHIVFILEGPCMAHYLQKWVKNGN
jgi:hypothetical protein